MSFKPQSYYEKLYADRFIFNELTRKQKVIEAFICYGKNLKTYCEETGLEENMILDCLNDIKESCSNTYASAFKLLENKN